MKSACVHDLISAFREKLAAGPVLGPFSKTCDPAFVEILGFSGFDFVILDTEHGPCGMETVQNLVRAAQIGGLLPIVRVKEGLPNSISEALDIGAGGVQAPQIRCAGDARRAVAHARFAPRGQRGVCRFVRAGGYSSMERGDYFRRANEALLILQLEGAQALEQIDDILEVPGYDVLFLGPYDLSQSLGRPGEVDHPAVVTAMTVAVEKAARRNRTVGIFADTPQSAAVWRDAGVRYLACSVDVGLFYEGCSAAVNLFDGC